MKNSLSEFIAHYQARVENQLTKLLSGIDSHDTKLLDAMRYSLLGGGKRIRPVLAYAAAKAVRDVSPATDNYACAVECIHVYSLIHDDLPAMDDDELRRGKATCHIAFDEATAILAGDALQALAFDAVARAESSAEQNLLAIQALTDAAGSRGMVIGQAIDLAAVDENLSLEQLEIMHTHKTGALIEAAVVLGAISAGASDEQLIALRHYAKSLGLAFQVQDDILDVTSDTQTLGKTQGADVKRNKPTYVSHLGLSAAQEKAAELRDDAIQRLAILGDESQLLIQLADFVVDRKH